MTSLDGVVVVTGAGRGLGRAESCHLARCGATIVVNDVDAQMANETVRLIEVEGGAALAVPGDTSDWVFAEHLIDRASDLGRLTGLVANAGITRDRMSFNLGEDAWDEMVRVNLKGSFAPIRRAVQLWRKRTKGGGPGGAIVTTSSRAGLYGVPGMAGYSATKAGIIGMSLALGRELERYDIRVNVLVPRAYTRLMEAMVVGRDGLPHREQERLAPRRVAPLVGYLLSDASASVSGHVFLVAGSDVRVMHPWQPGKVTTVDPNDGPAEVAARLGNAVPVPSDFDLYDGLQTGS